MGMNWIHRWLCSSEWWAGLVGTKLLPWALDGVPLGMEVLEIGPGFGATTRALAETSAKLTAIEIDPSSAALLRRRFDGRVRIVTGDATRMPLPETSFDAVVCFTMLHHVPSAAAQDELFAEALRMLRPGGVFAGSDSTPSLGFRMLHVGDTMVLVDPGRLPQRLIAAGFEAPAVTLAKGRFRFSATRPLDA
jgi:SAM-dependent methyltransferase